MATDPSISRRFYILCPGQGAQEVGMGRQLYEQPAARKVFDLADQVLGFKLSANCFEGPPERLNQTDVSQPALYATAVASFNSGRAAGVFEDADDFRYAGLSLGEYTALHLAGVFGFEEGLRLVAARGRFMQEAAEATPSGMVAIIGAGEATVIDLCEKARQGEVLVPANYNAPGQIVVSGAIAACRRFEEAAGAAGFKAVALKVAGAFHSPLMQPAADRMAAELEKVQFHHASGSSRVVYSNVTGKPHGDADSIKRLLVDQIVKPVRWEQTMQAILAEDPSARFVELSPGRTLAGLAKRINRRLPVESVEALAAGKSS
jgi:[acyl-carrier-protein] S-malonyltransferase